MKINITGRHLSISDRLKEYAETKIQKLEKYFNQLIDAHVILYSEKLDKGSEVIINGDGIQFHGRETASSLYSAIDLLFEKMEKQIIKYKEKHSSHKVTPQSDLIPFDYRSDEGFQIRMNQVSNKPIDKIEAFLQMKIDNSDYILFKKGIPQVDSNIDYLNKSYAVIYKSDDNFKLVKIHFDNMKESEHRFDSFIEYDMNIIDDSVSAPNIEFKKNPECGVKKLTLNEAIDEIGNTENTFMTFFNIESHYFNIIYKNGKDYEVMVPAF
jgi:putative sigma-54 modulation protein